MAKGIHLPIKPMVMAANLYYKGVHTTGYERSLYLVSNLLFHIYYSILFKPLHKRWLVKALYALNIHGPRAPTVTFNTSPSPIIHK